MFILFIIYALIPQILTWKSTCSTRKFVENIVAKIENQCLLHTRFGLVRGIQGIFVIGFYSPAKFVVFRVLTIPGLRSNLFWYHNRGLCAFQAPVFVIVGRWLRFITEMMSFTIIGPIFLPSSSFLLLLFF